MNVVGQLRQYGEMRRGWLGVHVQDVSDDVAKDQKMATTHGALVGSVEDGGPAAVGRPTRRRRHPQRRRQTDRGHA